MAMTICPGCSTPAQPGAIFCDNCGFDLRAVASSPQPSFMPANGEATCTVCGHQNVPGALFCENCGSQLGRPMAAPPPAAPPTPQPSPFPYSPGPPPKASPTPPPPRPPAGSISGRLVMQEGGIVIPIPSGKTNIVIGREDPVSGIFPDINLDPYGGQDAGVGRRHAQISLVSGQVVIQDLNSVNGTFINKQRATPQQSYPLQSGDEIRLGKMVLSYSATTG